MLPAHTKAGIDRYVSEYCPTGGFLYAVLTNNLFEAVERADECNLPNLSDICDYIYYHTPGACWGSPEKVAAWLLRRKI